MNEILDVFYNDFIKEAATGRIDCNMFYNILFATNILRDGKVEVLTTAKTNYQNVMVPTLEIKNEREWNDLLIKYVEQAIDFYDSKDFEDHHDHFKNTTPQSEWKSCLEHAEKIGIGTRQYEIIKVN